MIRPAGEADVVAVADAVEELLVELGGRRPARKEVKAEVRTIVEDPRAGLLLVAESDGTVLSIDVAEGDSVQEGDLIATVVPA